MSQRLTRRHFTRLLMGGSWAACQAAAACRVANSTVDSLRAAVAFLEAGQSEDGAWRSAHRGVFREGDALTPLVLWALEKLPSSLQPDKAIGRARRWLLQLSDDLSRSEASVFSLSYPLFTASYAARLYAVSGDKKRGEFWTNRMAELQLTEARGWAKSDPRFGGWSDASQPPRRHPDEEVPDMWNPNLSATTCALMGLQAAGRAEEAGSALPFVMRCQNYSGSLEAQTEWDDGGFFFALEDPIRNKAGEAGVDAQGVKRFRSYGATTCDGILSLLAGGLPVGHARVIAALRWLKRHAEEWPHPGNWPESRADSARALAFYYAHIFAEVLSRVSDSLPEYGSWSHSQMRAVSQHLSEQQKSDGSWANEEPESFEDDPVLATALAVLTLTRTLNPG